MPKSTNRRAQADRICVSYYPTDPSLAIVTDRSSSCIGVKEDVDVGARIEEMNTGVQITEIPDTNLAAPRRYT